MTDDKIRAILARAEKATPGPWGIGHPGKTGGICVDIMVGKNKTFRWVCQPFEEEDEDKTEARAEDWEFIAHSRADIPALCLALLAAREALRELVQAITAIECWDDDCPYLVAPVDKANAALGEEVKP